MIEELKLAAHLGFLLLPDPLLPRPATANGSVIRFDPSYPEAQLRAEVVRLLTGQALPARPNNTLTY